MVEFPDMSVVNDGREEMFRVDRLVSRLRRGSVRSLLLIWALICVSGCGVARYSKETRDSSYSNLKGLSMSQAEMRESRVSLE